MQHTANYKFSDKITSVTDFFDALTTAYSVGTAEKRTVADEIDLYQLTIYEEGERPNSQYEVYTLDDCLKLATSRLDFMYNLSKRGYLVADS